MAHKTTYTCDRCSKQGESPDFLLAVDVRIRSSYPTSYSDNMDVKKTAEWCQQCLHDTGLKQIYDVEKKKRVDPPPNPPTIEDLVREIVSEMIPQQ